MNIGELPKMKVFKCPDCDMKIEVPDDVENGEIFSCIGCGLELEYVFERNELQELTIENEDFGE